MLRTRAGCPVSSGMNVRNMLLKARYLLHLPAVGRLIQRPYHGQIQVTRRCNARCLYCRVWSENGAERNELSLEEMKVLSRSLRTAGLKSVVITGGEPLLRKDLTEIIAAFKNDGMLVRLQTNGILLTAGLLEGFFASGLDDIYISLDTLREEHFAAISGLQSEGVHGTVLRNIAEASATARRYRAGAFLITVVQQYNAGEIDDLVRFAKDNRCLIGFYGMEVGSLRDANDIRTGDRNLVPDDEQRERMRGAFLRARELKQQKDSPVFNSVRLIDDYLRFYAQGGQDMHWKCHAGEYYLVVLPDGSISVCNATPGMKEYDYRNIHELYRRPDTSEICRRYRKTCSGCICTRQLDYLISDPLDTLQKTWLYARATLFGTEGRS